METCTWYGVQSKQGWPIRSLEFQNTSNTFGILIFTVCSWTQFIATSRNVEDTACIHAGMCRKNSIWYWVLSAIIQCVRKWSCCKLWYLVHRGNRSLIRAYICRQKKKVSVMFKFIQLWTRIIWFREAYPIRWQVTMWKINIVKNSSETLLDS